MEKDAGVFDNFRQNSRKTETVARLTDPFSLSGNRRTEKACFA